MGTAMRKENQKAKPLFKRPMEFVKNVLLTKNLLPITLILWLRNLLYICRVLSLGRNSL